MTDFHSFSLPVLVALFVVAASFIWFAGTRLALFGDELSSRFNLSREFIGLIFLALVTELPEIVTTITAARAGNAALVLGNMFGGITMQTAILAVVDFFVVRHALTSWPRKPNHALVATLLIVLLAGFLAVTFVGDVVVVFNIGLAAVCLSGLYPLVIAMLRRFDEKQSWAPIDLPEDSDRKVAVMRSADDLNRISTRLLLGRTAFASLVILLAGVTLALTADALAEITALGASFVGIFLLAAATSLPEISTTFAAARIGAYTMALSNIFGSNLIMLALILPADMAYSEGPILSQADASAQFSLATGIVVTAIYVAGILIRRTPSLFGAGIDSWLVMSIYLASLVALYHF